jgi:hypothetical protein
MERKKKDFAVLFNIDKWLKATAGMDADARGWYVNLLLHQYDKNGLPNNLEDLALLAGVRFSEFGRFEHVFQHVLKQKFPVCEDDKLRNPIMNEIMMERNNFQDKRIKAGKVSIALKKYRCSESYNEDCESYFKSLIDENTDINNEQVFQHMLEMCSQHLISRSRNIELLNNKIGGVGERPNYTPSLDNQHVEVDQLKPILMQRTSWRDIQQKNGKYTDEQFEVTVNAFIEWLKEKGELTKTPKDARFHYNNFAKRKRSEKTVMKAPAYRKLD